MGRRRRRKQRRSPTTVNLGIDILEEIEKMQEDEESRSDVTNNLLRKALRHE